MHSNNYLNSHIDISVLLEYRKEVIVEYMNHTTKVATLGITATAIAIVTLVLVTAVTVSMMPVVYTAYAVSCPSHCACSPNGQNFACSGDGFGACGTITSCSISIGHGITEAGPVGADSASISSTGTHHSGSNGGATGGEGNCADTTCSGPK